MQRPEGGYDHYGLLVSVMTSRVMRKYAECIDDVREAQEVPWVGHLCTIRKAMERIAEYGRAKLAQRYELRE